MAPNRLRQIFQYAKYRFSPIALEAATLFSNYPAFGVFRDEDTALLRSYLLYLSSLPPDIPPVVSEQTLSFADKAKKSYAASLGDLQTFKTARDFLGPDWESFVCSAREVILNEELGNLVSTLGARSYKTLELIKREYNPVTWSFTYRNACLLFDLILQDHKMSQWRGGIAASTIQSMISSEMANT
jgi:hypothetical protein